MKVAHNLTLFFALLLICIGTGGALAQTPDGTPPASETVCDAETGAAYGLCNAYCEAMDCDDSEDPQASETACTKVRGKFLNITGRPLRCVPLATCPCAEAGLWERYLSPADASRASTVFNTVLNATPAIIRCYDSGGIASKSIDNDIGDGPEHVIYAWSTLAAGSTVSDNRCRLGDGLTYSTADLTITPEEGLACVQLIQASCDPQ